MTLTHVEAKKIAKIMCDATLHAFKDLIPSNYKLHTRVGHGKKTYHSQVEINQSVITYGFKAILSKQSSFSMAKKWRTTKEIIDFKFFNSEVTFKNIIIHTVIHEFSHLLQNLKGKRFLGYVHNDSFYSILKEMHNNHYHYKISEYFDKHYPEINNIQFNTEEDKKEESKLMFDSKSLNQNDFVKVVSRQKTMNMKIIKLNPKNAKAICLVSNETYNVPYSLIKEKLNKEDFKAIDNNLNKVESRKIPFNFKQINVLINGKMTKLDVLKINPKTVIAELKNFNQYKTYKVPYEAIIDFIE